MKTLLMATAALAFAGAVHAQTMTPDPQDAAAAQTPPTTQTQPMTQTAPAPNAQPDMTPQTAPGQPPGRGGKAAPPAQTPQQIVAADFDKYDTNHDGKLSQAEFDKWMIDIKAKSGKPLTAAEKKTALPVWFAKADTDKSKSLSLGEITKFLTAGA